MTQAGLDSYYTVINSCVENAISCKSAAKAMQTACNAENPKSWPHVRINNVATCPGTHHSSVVVVFDADDDDNVDE